MKEGQPQEAKSDTRGVTMRQEGLHPKPPRRRHWAWRALLCSLLALPILLGISRNLLAHFPAWRVARHSLPKHPGVPQEYQGATPLNTVPISSLEARPSASLSLTNASLSLTDVSLPREGLSGNNGSGREDNYSSNNGGSTNLSSHPAAESVGQDSGMPGAPRAALTDDECERLWRRQPGTPQGAPGVGSPSGYQRRENRCWSRDEFRCFAQSSKAGVGPPGAHLGPRPAPHPASPELLAALGRYQAHQRRCFALEPPARALAALRAGNATACQYVLGIAAAGGVGNQLLGLVSAFAYALMTDRVLLLEPRGNLMARMLCEPFEDEGEEEGAQGQGKGQGEGGGQGEGEKQGERGGQGQPQAQALSWLLPGIGDLPVEIRKAWRYRILANTRVNLSGPPPRVLPFHVHHRVDLQRYFCASFHLWARGASALLASSNMWWVPALAYVPHLRERMRTLFPSNDVFASLAPHVAHPNNRVWGRVTAWLQSLELHRVAPGTPLVGIQYRDKSGFSTDEALASTGKCLRALFRGLGKQERAVARGRGRLKGAGQGKTDVNVNVYLATLVPRFRRQLVARMRRYGIRANVTVMTTDKGQQTEDMGHNERALAEMLGLALVSGTLIASPRSTFGYGAVGFSSAQPWFLSGTCRRASREPCFLIPPASVNCSTVRGVLRESENPHVLGSKNFRPVPLPLDLQQIPAGPEVTIQGMDLRGSGGQVIAGECPDTRWLRSKPGAVYCPPGLALVSEWK